MRAPQQVEYRAMQALETLKHGPTPLQRDATWAHFAAWPGSGRKAARLLAAHANAARGRDVMWLVGVQTRLGSDGSPGTRIPGADLARFDAWLGSVLPWFDGVAPSVRAFSMPAGPMGSKGAKLIVVLQVETGRAPFVVRRDGNRSGPDVPWWDADAGVPRPASRQDLIRLLVPLQDLPQLEVLEADLTFYKNVHAGGASKAAYRWTLDGSIYIIPQAETRTIIPLHRCRGDLRIPGSAFSTPALDFNLSADKQSPAIRITDSAVLVEGLGRMFVYCSGTTTATEIPWQSLLTVTMDLPPATADRTAVAVATLHPTAATEQNQAARWKL